MKKSIVSILFILLVMASTSHAQRWKLRRWEAMMGVGTSNYFGDIGGAADEQNWFGLKDLEIGQTRPSFFLGVRYKIEPDLAIRGNLLYGYLSGNDLGSKNNDRAYSFSSTLFEPSVVAEYYFISEEERRRSSALFSKRGMLNNYSKIGVYFFAGVGGAFFNPELEADLSTRSLDEYGGYSKFTLAIPIGLGLKYVIDDNLSIGFSLGGRFTFSDYLDSFNPSVSANTANDIYYMSSLSVIYRVKTDRYGRPVMFRRR
jgi:hypothetical protein